MCKHETNVRPDYGHGDRRRAIQWAALCSCGWHGESMRSVGDALLDAARHKDDAGK